MKKSLAVLFILSIPILSFSQRAKSEQAIPETSHMLNQGIYMSIEEFLKNDPSIPYYFEVHNYPADYNVNPDERNSYVLSYCDDMGYRKVVSASEAWGYCDGEGVYVSFQGRAYELVHLGAISILRYKQHSNRNSIAQIFSLYALGRSVMNMDKCQDVLFNLRSDSVIIPTARNIRNLIAEDAELYRDYQRERNMDYFERNLVYLQKYNEKYPVTITNSMIIVPEPPSNVSLVDKQPL
jgi:hypothetical protein